MSEGVDDIVLVYLRRMDSRLERMEDDLRDLRHRASLLEEGVAHMGQQYAGLQSRLDQIESRLERVERRLDLYEARA